MKLTIEPSDSLVDEVPQLRVEDAPVGAPVTVTVATTDAAGHRWQSSTVLTEDTDRSELWWSMAFASEGESPVAFTAPADQLEYQVRAEAGTQSDTAVVTRRWLAGATRQDTSVGEGFRLTSFSPDRGKDHPGVLILPGSIGSKAVEPMAALLASHGYATAVLAYIQEPGLPAALKEIPLESLAAGYRAFARSAAVMSDLVAVLASSVGTGGALAMAAYAADINPRGLVAISPTHVVWQALGADGPPPKASSWTLDGAPLPWAQMHGERLLPQMISHALLNHVPGHDRPKALHLRGAYAAGLSKETADNPATIPVERIRCPLLLVSGQDDQMWPSRTMADAIMDRRRRPDDHHLSFPDAGHFFRPPVTPTTVPWNDSLFSGGTAVGNARAQGEGWQAILGFLSETLTGRDRNTAGNPRTS